MTINKKAVEDAEVAVRKHKFSSKDVKKLKKKIRILRRSRMPGTDAVADAIQKVLDEKTV